MASRLKVQEFMVLTTGGVPVFSYSPISSKKLDELLSGFLSAISSFASEFGERSVQSLSFEGSEILYEQSETEQIFILLVDAGAPVGVLRAVLRDLSRKFIHRYGDEAHDGLQIPEKYDEFASEVKRSFSFYDGVLLVTSNLTTYVVPTVNRAVLDAASSFDSLLDEFHRDLGGAGNRVLEAIDGRSTLAQISDTLGLEIGEVREIIEYLAIWGVVRISKTCPSIHVTDSRFDAFLELIGLPSRDHQLLDRAKSLCDGKRSIEEISERLGVTAERLYEMLKKLGNEVDWRLVEMRVGSPA